MGLFFPSRVSWCYGQREHGNTTGPLVPVTPWGEYLNLRDEAQMLRINQPGLQRVGSGACFGVERPLPVLFASSKPKDFRVWDSEAGGPAKATRDPGGTRPCLHAVSIYFRCPLCSSPASGPPDSRQFSVFCLELLHPGIVCLNSHRLTDAPVEGRSSVSQMQASHRPWEAQTSLFPSPFP